MSILSNTNVNLTLRIYGLIILLDFLTKYKTTSSITTHPPNTTNLCNLTNPYTTNPLHQPHYHHSTTHHSPFNTYKKPSHSLHLLNSIFNTNIAPFEHLFTSQTIFIIGILSSTWLFCNSNPIFTPYITLPTFLSFYSMQQRFVISTSHGDRHLFYVLGIHTLHDLAILSYKSWTYLCNDSKNNETTTKQEKIHETNQTNQTNQTKKEKTKQFTSVTAFTSISNNSTTHKIHTLRNFLLLFHTTHIYFTGTLLKLNSTAWGNVLSTFNPISIFNPNTVITSATTSSFSSSSSSLIWGNAIQKILLVNEWTTPIGRHGIQICQQHPWCNDTFLIYLSPIVVLFECIVIVLLLYTFPYSFKFNINKIIQKKKKKKNIMSTIRNNCIAILITFHGVLLLLFRFGLTFHATFIVSLITLWSTPIATPSFTSSSTSITTTTSSSSLFSKSTSRNCISHLIISTIVLLLHLFIHVGSMSSTSPLRHFSIFQSWYMYAPEPFDMDLNLFLIQKKEIMLHQEEDDPNDQNDPEQILLIHELYARPRHIRDFITLTSIVAMEDAQRNRFLRSMIDTYYCTATTAATGGGGATPSSSTFEILILMHQQNKNQHLCTSTTLIQKMICNDDIF